MVCKVGRGRPQYILEQLSRRDVSQVVWLSSARSDACETRRIHASVRTYVGEALLVNPDLRGRNAFQLPLVALPVVWSGGSRVTFTFPRHFAR